MNVCPLHFIIYSHYRLILRNKCNHADANANSQSSMKVYFNQHADAVDGGKRIKQNLFI